MFRKRKFWIVAGLLSFSMMTACSKEKPVTTPPEQLVEDDTMGVFEYQLEDTYYMVDDFEAYAQDEELSKAYIRNNNGGDLSMSVEKENKVEGNQSLFYTYDYKSIGYAGAVKDTPGLNLNEYDGFVLWSDMDGSGNSITLQVADAEGLTWECVGYLDSKGGKDLYVPFDSFKAPSWDTNPRREFDKTIAIEKVGIYTNQAGERLQGKLYFDAIRGANFEAQLRNAKVEITTQINEPITAFPYQVIGTAENVRYITLCFDKTKVNVPVINGKWSYNITEYDRVYKSENTELFAEITYMNGTAIAQSTKQNVTFNVEGDFDIPDEYAIVSDNLAYRKPVTASSMESNEHKPEFAIDENDDTRWSSAYEDGHYIIVDMEEEKEFNYILLQWEAAYAKEYKILGSNDNQEWSVLYEQNDSQGGNELINIPNSKARYIKIDCITRATEYGNSLYEIGVYVDEPEMPVDEDALDEAIHAQAKDTIKPYAGEGEIGVLDFLKEISGKYTITSIHNKEPNAEPTKQTDRMWTRTGLTPAMWSGDFLFAQSDIDNRWTMIEECKKQWEQGSIVQLMLHVTAPTQEEVGPWEGGVLTELTDDEWESLIQDGGELNKVWKERLDIYCEYLQYLEDNNVTVLFRPFHEMNQSAFWWGGRPGENGTAALYRLTRDYIENEKGLDNIIWVWNMQDLDYEWEAYNPGDEYWDIFCVDFYNGDGYTDKKYDLAVSIAGDKPMGIGECSVLPRPDELEAQPKWVFFMSWAELTFDNNTSEEMRDLYWSDRTLVREELPKLK